MRISVFELKYVEVKLAAKRRIAKAEREGLCLACMEPLDDSGTTRGCHERCYRATIRAIAKGQTTDAERVLDGKLGERQPPGRKASNPVTAEFQ